MPDTDITAFTLTPGSDSLYRQSVTISVGFEPTGAPGVSRHSPDCRHRARLPLPSSMTNRLDTPTPTLRPRPPYPPDTATARPQPRPHRRPRRWFSRRPDPCADSLTADGDVKRKTGPTLPVPPTPPAGMTKRYFTFTLAQQTDVTITLDSSPPTPSSTLRSGSAYSPARPRRDRNDAHAPAHGLPSLPNRPPRCRPAAFAHGDSEATHLRRCWRRDRAASHLTPAPACCSPPPRQSRRQRPRPCAHGLPQRPRPTPNLGRLHLLPGRLAGHGYAGSAATRFTPGPATLTVTSHVLESSLDTFLYRRNPGRQPRRRPAWLVEKGHIAPGSNLNSQISQSLPATNLHHRGHHLRDRAGRQLHSRQLATACRRLW